MKRSNISVYFIMCIVMMMLTGCHSSTKVEFNKEGRGTYTTVSYFDEQMIEKLPQMEEIIRENIPEGVNISVSTKVVDGKAAIETSIKYDSLDDFNEQLVILNDLIEDYADTIDNMEYGSANNINDEDIDKKIYKLVNEYVEKSVNVYLEEETFSYALKDYLRSNGIYIEENSNMYRKILKLIMSVVRIDEEIVEELSNEYTDEIVDEDEYINEDFWHNNEYDNWDDEDAEYEIDGPSIEKEGYAFFQKNNNEKVLKVHIDSLIIISEFISYVLQMNLSEELMNEVTQYMDMMTELESVDEERCELYNKVFTEIGLAEKLKSAVEDINLDKNEFNIDSLKPHHVIDIFTDEYISLFNETLDLYVTEVVEDNLDETFSADEEDYIEDVYILSFGKEYLELNEFDLYDYSDEFGYLTLYENGFRKNHKKNISNKIENEKFDDTPNTADNMPVMFSIVIVIVATVSALYFYNKRKYC